MKWYAIEPLDGRLPFHGVPQLNKKKGNIEGFWKGDPHHGDEFFIYYPIRDIEKYREISEAEVFRLRLAGKI